jgi:HPt (histidine-containing phosphotransfer) domain-containing protein
MRGAAPDPRLDALTTSFLRNKQAEFGVLAQASPPDLSAIAVAAHRLRGAGGAYGFDALSEAAALLEAAAGDRDVDAARRALQQINKLLSSLIGN